MASLSGKDEMIAVRIRVSSEFNSVAKPRREIR